MDLYCISLVCALSTVADLGGSARCPPHGPKFSQFHAVFREIWQNHMLVPHPPPEGSRPLLRGILDPPLVNVHWCRNSDWFLNKSLFVACKIPWDRYLWQQSEVFSSYSGLWNWPLQKGTVGALPDSWCSLHSTGIDEVQSFRDWDLLMMYWKVLVGQGCHLMCGAHLNTYFLLLRVPLDIYISSTGGALWCIFLILMAPLDIFLILEAPLMYDEASCLLKLLSL